MVIAKKAGFASYLQDSNDHLVKRSPFANHRRINRIIAIYSEKPATYHHLATEPFQE
jgi:hypothetical protein